MGSTLLLLAAEYGTPVILAIVILAILFWLVKSYTTANIKNWFTFSKDHPRDEKQELVHHIFFTNAQYRMASEIPYLELIPNKPVKERMIKDLITIHTKVIYDTGMEIINSPMEDWTAEEWNTNITTKITEMIAKKIKKDHEEGFPEVVINKYNKLHARRFETLYEYIFLLSVSPYYEDNFARTNTFLLIMNLFLITILADVEKSVGELNGSVGGQQYKNMTIES